MLGFMSVPLMLGVGCCQAWTLRLPKTNKALIHSEKEVMEQLLFGACECAFDGMELSRSVKLVQGIKVWNGKPARDEMIGMCP